jgi:hypothetical protein
VEAREFGPVSSEVGEGTGPAVPNQVSARMKPMKMR